MDPPAKILTVALGVFPSGHKFSGHEFFRAVKSKKKTWALVPENERHGRSRSSRPRGPAAKRQRSPTGLVSTSWKSTMVGAPAFMRGSSAFKPSGSRRTILLRLQPRGFPNLLSQRNRLNAPPGVEAARRLLAAHRGGGLPALPDHRPAAKRQRSPTGLVSTSWKSTMVGAPAFMRGSSAFKPSGSRRTILLRLQPRGFQTFSPSATA